MDVPTGFHVTVEDGGIYVRLPEVEVTENHVYQPVLTRKDVRQVAEWIESKLLLLPVHVTVLRPARVDAELADDFAVRLKVALDELRLSSQVQVVTEAVEPAPPPPAGPESAAPPAEAAPPLPPAPVPRRRREHGGSQER